MAYISLGTNGFRSSVRPYGTDIKIKGCKDYFTPSRVGVKRAIDFVRSLGYKRCADTTQTVYDLLMAGF